MFCCPELFGPWLRTWAMFKTALVEIYSLESRRCRADRSAYCMFLSGPSLMITTVHAQCGSGCAVIGPPNRLRPSSRFSHVPLSISDDVKTCLQYLPLPFMPTYIFALGCNARLSATSPNCAPIAAIRRSPWPRTFAYAPQSSLVRDPPGTVNKRTAATASGNNPSHKDP